MLYGRTFQESPLTTQVDGPTLTAAAAASMLPAAGKLTLPANYFDVIGRKAKFIAWGRISSVVTTPGTARYDLRFDAAVVFDGLAILLDTVAGHTNVGWKLEIDLTCRAIGTAGNLMGQGVWTCEDILGVPATAPKGVLTAILPWNTAPVVGTNFDTTVAHVVDSFFTQTAATGSMTCHQAEILLPN